MDIQSILKSWNMSDVYDFPALRVLSPYDESATLPTTLLHFDRRSQCYCIGWCGIERETEEERDRKWYSSAVEIGHVLYFMQYLHETKQPRGMEIGSSVVSYPRLVLPVTRFRPWDLKNTSSRENILEREIFKLTMRYSWDTYLSIRSRFWQVSLVMYCLYSKYISWSKPNLLGPTHLKVESSLRAGTALQNYHVAVSMYTYGGRKANEINRERQRAVLVHAVPHIFGCIFVVEQYNTVSLKKRRMYDYSFIFDIPPDVLKRSHREMPKLKLIQDVAGKKWFLGSLQSYRYCLSCGENAIFGYTRKNNRHAILILQTLEAVILNC